MGLYRVTMRVEIDRYLDAESEEDAINKVDKQDMVYELQNYGIDEEYYAEKIEGE